MAVALVGLPAPSQALTWDLHLNMAGPPGTYYFSPNGDGRREVARGFYRLAGRAKVSLQVRGDAVAATISLGRKSAGPKVLRWHGKDDTGRALRDGTYRLRIVARTADGAVIRGDWAWVAIDTKITKDRLRSYETTVYPRTPGVVDGLSFDYFASIPQAGEFGRVRGRVVDATGRVVDRLGLPDEWGYTFCEPSAGGGTRCGQRDRWTARRDGQPLPAGAYRLQMIRYDQAGNRTQVGMGVIVSDTELVAEQKSVTVPAGGDTPRLCSPGCGDIPPCGEVVEPGRFGASSLSYRAGDDCPEDQPYSYASASHSIPFDDTAYTAFSDFRVTAYGGPTVPGAGDQGLLLVGYPDNPELTTGPDTSDHETTSAWAPIDPGYGAKPSIGWTFATRDANRYDVAWFRVDYIVFHPPT